MRIGNQAFEHVQNDVYGEMVLAVSRLFLDTRFVGEIPPQTAVGIVQTSSTRWRRASRSRTPASGSSGAEADSSFSVLMHWAGSRRAVEVAEALGAEELAAGPGTWSGAQASCSTPLLERRDRRADPGRGQAELDAALLLAVHLGYLAHDDPRATSHVDATRARLSVDGGLLRRYSSPDDFGMPHAAFTVCTFWLVEALAILERTDEARELFDYLLSLHNGLGLYSEDILPDTLEQSGNFPQTYSHVGLINAAFQALAPLGLSAPSADTSRARPRRRAGKSRAASARSASACGCPGARGPAITVGMPRRASAATIGSVPPARTTSGCARRRSRRPRARAGAQPCRAGARGGVRSDSTSSVAPSGRASRRIAPRPRRAPRGLARGDADRHAGRGRRHERRVAEAGLPAEDARHVERGLDERANVELLRRLRVERHRADPLELLCPRWQLAPARELLLARRRDARRGSGSGRREGERGESLRERVDRVQRRPAVVPRVEIARRCGPRDRARRAVATTSSGRLRRFIQPSRITQASSQARRRSRGSG